MTDDTPSPGRVRPRAGRLALVAGAVAVTGIVAVGAVAWAGAATDPEAPAAGPDDHDQAGAGTTATAGRDGTAPGAGGAGRGGRHRHPTQPPYADRYAAAPAGEQQAADELVADVRATLAAYADPTAAVAAGYRATGPRRSPGPVQHYLNRGPGPATATSSTPPAPRASCTTPASDRARPAGRVLRRPGRCGGADARRPTWSVWHSHDPACPAFFATDDDAVHRHAAACSTCGPPTGRRWSGARASPSTCG